MPNYRKEEDPDVLDLDEEPSAEELETQVQRAQAELTELKRRSEQIEKDKQRLEELSRRQEELERGRAEMVDRLTRSMVVLQRETQDAEKRLDQLHTIHNSFLTHLRTLETINPKEWSGPELAKELSKALSSVDDARAEYTKNQAKLTTEVPAETPGGAVGDYEEYYGGGDRGFMYWLTAGFAFTLPVMVLATLIAILVWLAGSGVGQ